MEDVRAEVLKFCAVWEEVGEAWQFLCTETTRWAREVMRGQLTLSVPAV